MSEEQGIKADYSLDCLGLYCPMPIVKTVERMKRMAPGEVLEVIADDQGFEPDIKAWCAMTKNECLATRVNNSEVRAYVKKRFA